MKPFAMRVLNEALKKVRSRQDAQALAELLNDYAFCDLQDPVFMDKTLEEKLLALLINHEVATADNPDFANIHSLVFEWSKLPDSLRQRADWIEHATRHDTDVQNHIFLSLNQALWSYNQLGESA